MKKYVSLQCYINQYQEVIIVPYKKCKFGFSLACDDWTELKKEEWECTSEQIVSILSRLKVEGPTEETKSEAFKKHGIKNFKTFSKKHICIIVTYEYEDEKVIIEHSPRLPDGSYGVYSEQLHLITKYQSGLDIEDIQKNFNRAYEDAKLFAKKP